MNDVLTAFSTYNGYAPEQGPKVAPFTLDFSSVSEYNIDLLLENTLARLQFVQGIYVDNSRNPNELTVVVKVTGQRLIVQPGAQQTAPLFAPDQTQLVISSPVEAGSFSQIILLNVPTAYNSWGPLTVNVPPISSAPYQATLDNADTQNVDDTAPVVLFAANPDRAALALFADPSNTEPVVVLVDGDFFTALSPGQPFNSGGYVPMGEISAVGLSANIQIISGSEFV